MAQVMPVPGPSQDDFDALSGQVSTLNGNLMVSSIQISKPASTVNYVATGLDSRNYIALSVYEQSGGSGAVCCFGNSGNAIFVYIFQADGSPYTGAINLDVFYKVKT